MKLYTRYLHYQSYMVMINAIIRFILDLRYALLPYCILFATTNLFVFCFPIRRTAAVRRKMLEPCRMVGLMHLPP